jgi:hypothetical protein
MLFAGREGIGKRRVALELARSFLCEGKDSTYGGCGACASCVQLSDWVSPDFYFVDSADKDVWNVEGYRDLLSRLQLRAFKGGARIVLVDNADCLSIQVANILLKIVEEPRPDLYFVFVAQNPSRLPRTLLSRCQLWYFDALRDEDIAAVLTERSDDGTAASQEVIRLADGSLGDLDNHAALAPLWNDCQDKLQKICDGDCALAVEFAEFLKAEKGVLRDWLKVMLLVGKHKRDSLACLSTNSLSKKIGEMQKWALFVRNCLQAEYLLGERHLAPFPLLQVLFLDLATGHSEVSKSLQERIGL